ncbi:glycine betaine/L-proline ABC transporter ATP-binding protein [Vibrio sinensis]|uniref:Quaternary amine transport ATP-binding protein n=1 Tax=Vibrio sinensis TaxID=2302434 RepID=A0A3A6QCH9_9VIBR|nr:glycine betaine/L-proline ABC transporter ATP-binding protein [Vibrio sinensis]RJX65201.1 glycine betaine/L-proline ABC transporter ATP-binding protein [Vibrio sinensis]
MTNAFIEISGLYKIFGRNPDSVIERIHQGESKERILAETAHTVGLKDVNLTIKQGEVFVIMGLSGSGKSTLIRHFNRLIEPTLGTIIIDNVDVMKLDSRSLEQFRRQRMSMVFQRFGLLPHRNVIHNIAYGLEVQGIAKKERLNKARHWLEMVGLDGYQKHYPAQLSGGQQQRVGLARALCTDADILLMDEAFSALDPLIRSEMQDQLIELQQKLHKTIIFITHDLDEALRLGDRIAILKDGWLVQQGTPDEILLDPADDYVEAFVKDVNRARALTVDAIMSPTTNTIIAKTVDEAIIQIKRRGLAYAYHITENGYQGRLTQTSLLQVIGDEQNCRLCRAHYETVPSVSPDDAIESVLDKTMLYEHALPVVDEQGTLIGELEKKTVAAIFIQREKPDEADKNRLHQDLDQAS